MINENEVLFSLSELSLKKSGNNWLGTCPLCHKQKLYVLTKGKFVLYCHKCPEMRISLSKWVKENRPDLYSRYYEGFFKKDFKVNIKRKERSDTSDPIGSYLTLEKPKECTSIKNLIHTHPAVEYIKWRKLPTYAHDWIYYTDDYRNVVKAYGHESWEKFRENDRRIITPFWGLDNKIKFIQARTLPDVPKSYNTITVEEGHPKIWGLHRIDQNKRIYMLEAAFDGMLFENGGGMAGANISNYDMLKIFPNVERKDIVFVFDNEQEVGSVAYNNILKEMEMKIDFGFSIVFWPNWLKSKDPTEMVQSGEYDINNIDSLIYSGPLAKIKFKMEKK